jgi:hypothetical protein
LGFHDTAQPTSYLTPPEDYSGDVLGQPYANPGMGLDWLSPSHLISEFIKSIGGPDIFGEAAQAVAGDWEKVYRTGSAFQKLAEAVPAIGFNVSSGNVELDGLWEGNAADSAFMYFAGLSAAISGQQLALFKLGELYMKAAEGVWRLQEAVSGILKDITDMCLLAMAEAAAGTALIETGLGAAAGYALAALEIEKILSTIERAKKIISTGVTAISSIVGEIQAITGDLGELKKYPLPGQPYRHPGSA